MQPEPASSPPAIRLRGLAKTYAGGVEAIRPLDIDLAAGQTTAMVGPSGCGKSTILRLVAGLETPSAGSVEIAGEPPGAIRRRGELAVAFQDPSLLPWRTVRGNIRLALKLARQPSNDAAIEQLIRLVGLEGFGDVRPGALSGGMRQRTAIARCLVTQPRLLLLDEPFGAVDELTRQQLIEDLPRIWEARGTTALLVTHSISEAVMLSDRILVFSPRPAEVVADISVPLKHPRAPRVSGKLEFLRIAERVSEALAQGQARSDRPLAAQ